MKTYREQFIDGLYTVPDLHLDWDSILSDKGDLWTKYKFALLKFYYSPNHEGSCTDVAREFDDKYVALHKKGMFTPFSYSQQYMDCSVFFRYETIPFCHL